MAAVDLEPNAGSGPAIRAASAHSLRSSQPGIAATPLHNGRAGGRSVDHFDSPGVAAGSGCGADFPFLIPDLHRSGYRTPPISGRPRNV